MADAAILHKVGLRSLENLLQSRFEIKLYIGY